MIVPVVGTILRDKAVEARWPAPFSLVTPTDAVVNTPFVKYCFLVVAPDIIVISNML